ncbi:hypothetical protein EBT25_08660 [bacterium]|nr:hypothetical protein [bacterium]
MADFNPDAYLSQKTGDQVEFDPNTYLGISPRSLPEELVRQVGLTGRAAYEGFTAPATVVLEGVRNLYNLFAPESKQMPSIAESQSKMLTRAGLPEAETGFERAVQAGTQAMTGTGTLSSIAQKVTPAAVALTQNVPGQLISAGVGGAVAQPTAEAVKTYTGSDLAATLAGIGIGGIVGGAASKGAMSLVDRFSKAPTMTMDDVRLRANRLYTKVDNFGVKLTPTNAESMVKNIADDLEQQGYLVTADVNAPALRMLEKMSNTFAQGKTSLEDIAQLRTAVNKNIIASTDPTLRKIGMEMVAGIDNHLANLKPDPNNFVSGMGNLQEALKTLGEARKDWRNLSRATTLENILNIAEAKALDPKASESELIRRGFINLAANQNKMKMFTEQERNAIRAVANGGPVDALLSFVAQFNPERGKMAALATTSASVAKPEFGIPLATTGFLADRLQGLLRRQAAESAISGLLSGNLPKLRPDATTGGLLGGIMTEPLSAP